MSAHHEILARAVRTQDGLWGTHRVATVLRNAGVPVGAGDRADDKQARKVLRRLRDDGLLVQVPSAGNTAVYRRA